MSADKFKNFQTVLKLSALVVTHLRSFFKLVSLNRASPADFIYIDLREFFHQTLSENSAMGLGQSKKDRAKVKVINNNFLFTVGKIVVRKGEDFDILCLDLDFYGYFLTVVRAWPENCLSRPQTPNIYLDRGNISIDSSVDHTPQSFFFKLGKKYE